MTSRSWLWWFVLAAACHKQQMLDAELPGPAIDKTLAKTVQEQRLPDGAIDRPQLDRVLREGPAWVFDKVLVEEVLQGGKFVGWRVRELPGEWSQIDLRAGDVVTKVNAMSIETPNDFWAAWTTLSVASELKIDYLRDAEARVLSVPIVGQPDPRLPATLHSEQRGEPSPRRQPRNKRFDTITIAGEAQSPDAPVDWTTRD